MLQVVDCKYWTYYIIAVLARLWVLSAQQPSWFLRAYLYIFPSSSSPRHKSIPYPLDPRIYPPLEINTFSFHEPCFDPWHSAQPEPGLLCPRRLRCLISRPTNLLLCLSQYKKKKKKTSPLSPWSLKIAAAWEPDEHVAFNKLMIKPSST